KDIARLSQAAKRTADWSDKVEKSKYEPLASGLSADKGYIGHKAAKMMKRAKAIEKRQTDAAEEKSKLLKNLETTDELTLRPIEYHADKLIEIRDVSIRYEKKIVCGNVTFDIHRGDRAALRGKNGSGKSTILKLLNREDISYEGNLRIGKNLIISYVQQDISRLSGTLKSYAKENGIDESLFKTILIKLDFSREQFDKDIADFSQGQKKKTLLAKSLCESAHIYIWDEPLNFIDVLSRLQVENLILKYSPTMLFVEHDRAFIEKIATKTIEL
ncbi:MAG: ATP-binding cassette domain-containing protein, partial [Clostridiales bacterium]|nr:ATP-binding cassette domain-containing protein [Clostridiales bacterium]